MNNKKFDNINIPTNINDSIEKGIKRALIEKQSKRHKLSKLVPKIVAASFIGTLFIGVTNPAMAAKIPLIGKVFKSIEKDILFTGEYSKYATIINKSVSSNEITITASEVLSDGQFLYITYIVENENPFKYKNKETNLGFEEVYNKVNFTNKSLDNSFYSGLEGKFIGDNKFIGVQKFNLADFDKKVPDEFSFQTKLTSIYYSDTSSDNSHKLKGEWEFDVPVKVSKDLRKTINIDNLNNDYLDSISLSVSPFDMILNTSYKAGVWDDYRTMVYDENGEELKWTNEGPSDSNKESTKYLQTPGNNKSIRIKIIKQEHVEIESKPGYYDIKELGVVFDETISLEK